MKQVELDKLATTLDTEFEVGDTVICVNARESFARLGRGTKYTVTRWLGRDKPYTGVYVGKCEQPFNKNRFRKVPS